MPEQDKVRAFHSAAGGERGAGRLGQAPPGKQGYVHDISSHLLAAVKGLLATLAVPRTFTFGAIYSGFGCLDLDPLWVLRKQRDGDASRGDTSGQMPFEDIRDSSMHRSRPREQGLPIGYSAFCAHGAGQIPANQRGSGGPSFIPSDPTSRRAAFPAPPAETRQLRFCELPAGPIEHLPLPPGQPRGTEMLSPCVQSQCSWCASLQTHTSQTRATHVSGLSFKRWKGCWEGDIVRPHAFPSAFAAPWQGLHATIDSWGGGGHSATSPQPRWNSFDLESDGIELCEATGGNGPRPEVSCSWS